MALKALQRILDSSESAKRALQTEMKDAKAKSAEALSAAHREAEQALADLKKKYDAATAQVADLSAKVEELKQSQAESNREHEAQLAEAASKHQAALADAAAREEARADEVVKEYQAQVDRERQQLKERVAFYRTALEGKEPERSAQLGSLQEQAQQERAAREAAEQAMKDLNAAKDGLAQRLAEAGRALEEKMKGLKQAQNELAEAETRLKDAARPCRRCARSTRRLPRSRLLTYPPCRSSSARRRRRTPGR
jgi:chromosome segregation ATPase